MYTTILDTKTGKTIKDKSFDYSFYWWADGNGCCYCNRARIMGEDIYEELQNKFGIGRCFGSNRFLVIDVHGDLEDMTKYEILKEINNEYLEELVNTYLKQQNKGENMNNEELTLGNLTDEIESSVSSIFNKYYKNMKHYKKSKKYFAGYVMKGAVKAIIKATR